MFMDSRMHFMAVRKSWKRSDLAIHSYFKNTAFVSTSVWKGYHLSIEETSMWKGYHLSIEETSVWKGYHLSIEETSVWKGYHLSIEETSVWKGYHLLIEETSVWKGHHLSMEGMHRGIEKGKGCDLRGYISVATKEMREETFARRLEIDG